MHITVQKLYTKQKALFENSILKPGIYASDFAASDETINMK